MLQDSEVVNLVLLACKQLIIKFILINALGSLQFTNPKNYVLKTKLRQIQEVLFPHFDGI